MHKLGLEWTYDIRPQLNPVRAQHLDLAHIVEIILFRRGVEVNVLGQRGGGWLVCVLVRYFGRHLGRLTKCGGRFWVCPS